MIAMLLAMSASPPPMPWYGTAGRILTTPTLHLGIRPAVHVDRNEFAAGLTLQITTHVL
jgi:hypothetical protein